MPAHGYSAVGYASPKAFVRERRGARDHAAMAETHRNLSVVGIAGSPTAGSRSAALLRLVERRLADRALFTCHLPLRELRAADLLLARAEARCRASRSAAAWRWGWGC